ncbi:MAG: hypothetical protein KC547_17140 [Anaerolineae bacterium]|nr:hypothetical protein [Anaerolineae bacterium]
MKQRGIVIAPYLTVSGGEVREVNYVEATHLRKCALYFDLIDLPLATEPEIKNADVDLLRQESILQETHGHFFVKDGETWKLSFGVFEHPQEYWEIVQLYALYRHREDDQNWTLGQINMSFAAHNLNLSQFAFVDTGAGKVAKLTKGAPAVPHDFVTIGASIELELLKALPVPSSSVPMQSVLEFKRKRQAELLQFRHAWDGLILEATRSTELVRATEYSKDTIERALIDLHRVMDESRLKKILRDIKVDVDVLHVAAAVVAGAEVAQRVGLDAFIGAIGGAAAAISIKLNLTSRKPKEIPSELKDYAYLYHVEKELDK